MKYITIIFLFLICAAKLSAQQDDKLVNGKISYMSSQNVYVKFESTKSFKIGDTLFIKKDNKTIPVLVINNLSSTSCVCTPISASNLSVSMQIYGRRNEKNLNKDDILPKLDTSIITEIKDTNAIVETDITKRPEFLQKVSGSVSASGYSYFSNVNGNNSNKFRYQFSLNAANIGNSKFSAEVYTAFQHEIDNWSSVQDNIFNALKFYNLSVKYDNKKTQIVFGRKINPKISNIGAIDGLQYQQNWAKFSVGGFAGFRPDYSDYGFNFNLPQFGAYVAQKYSNVNGEMQNTLALVQQMNGSKTDRRFAYFQHSNSLAKKLNMFASFEFELYKNIDSIAQNTLELSNTYLLLSYRPHRKIGLSLSYDNRKNVIYYETFKSFINQILEIEARKGLGLQVNYYSHKNLSIGLKSGYRFKNKNSKETINLYGYVSYYNIPGLELNTTIAFNYIETNYIQGKIINLNISRNFLENNLYIDGGYQLVYYIYPGSENTSLQNIINLGLNFTLVKNLSISANYEETLENNNPFGRLSFQVRKRF
jgi:hypothetical protein